MWEIVRAGGPFMWPIVLCSIGAAAIILERLWTLQEKRVLPRDLTSRLWQLVEANQINDKVIAALEQNSPLGRVLAAGLANRHRSREIMMERLEDAGRHVVHDLERFLNMLGTIASISPLLGLLGTVTGIIKAFDALQAGAAGDPRMLSGGIAEALIATAAGLCVAIPALIAYRYLRGRVEGFVIEMEKGAIKLADALEAAGHSAHTGHAGHAGHTAQEVSRVEAARAEAARVEALRGEGAREERESVRPELLKARR